MHFRVTLAHISVLVLAAIALLVLQSDVEAQGVSNGGKGPNICSVSKTNMSCELESCPGSAGWQTKVCGALRRFSRPVSF